VNVEKEKLWLCATDVRKALEGVRVCAEELKGRLLTTVVGEEAEGERFVVDSDTGHSWIKSCV
jgi:hypothetical protein